MNENRKKSIQSNKIEFSGYIRPGKKRVLVLVFGRVDFDANKKKCGLQNVTRHREKYQVWYFHHLSIIDDRIHVCILT